jgi:hypothetical protein
MIENIQSNAERGLNRMEAALVGREADRLHRPFDQPLARRLLYRCSSWKA